MHATRLLPGCGDASGYKYEGSYFCKADQPMGNKDAALIRLRGRGILSSGMTLQFCNVAVL